MSVLVFDTGGTNMRIALSLDGRRLKNFIIRPTPKTWPSALKMFHNYLKQFAHSSTIRMVVGGLPAMLDSRQRMLVAPHLPGWVGRPVKRDLERLIGARVQLENDAALGGLGEANYGRGRGYRIVAYLPIGTGIGGARIVRGKIDARARGFEPGHQIIGTSKAGRPQTLEHLVSGSNIRRRFGSRPEQITSRRIWRQLATELAYGLINVIELWAPDVIILGGGLMAGYRRELPTIRRIVRTTIAESNNLPRIVEGKLGHRAALLGALVLAQQKGT